MALLICLIFSARKYDTNPRAYIFKGASCTIAAAAAAIAARTILTASAVCYPHLPPKRRIATNGIPRITVIP
jgi:hypothetical protein